MAGMLAVLAFGMMVGGAQALTVQAVELTRPANASPTPINPALYRSDGVSDEACGADGSCVAVGTYEQTSGSSNLVAYSETDGSWGSGVQLPVPANATNQGPDGPSGLNSVACPAAASCIAVGEYSSTTSPTGNPDCGLAESESGSVWTASQITMSDDDDCSVDNVEAASVACSSTSNCTAVGGGGPTGAFLAQGSVESLGEAVAVSPPADNPGAKFDLSEVSCGPTLCVAAGGNFLVTQVNGVWGSAVDDWPLPPGGTAGSGSIWSAACSTTACYAVGEYEDSSDVTRGLILTSTGGAWTASATPGVAGNGYRYVSCARSFNYCVVSGPGTPGATGDEAEVQGTWTPLQGPGTSTSYELTNYICTTSGPCFAADYSYVPNGAPLYTNTVVEAVGADTTTVESVTPPINCVGDYCEFFATPTACAESSCIDVNYYADSSGHTQYAAANLEGAPSSATVVGCAQLTDGTTNYTCTATVSDSSGEVSPGTPTDTVSLSSTLGTFPNGSSCTLAAGGTAGTATCSLNFDPGGGYGNPVTIAASYSGDGNFAPSQGQVTFTPQCHQDPTVTDGAWQVGGCFTNPDTSDDDTQQTSTLDGLTVTPSGSSDQVDYSTGGGSGQSLSTSASTSLALNVSTLSGGSQGLVTLTNKLATLSLSGGPVTIPLASGFKLLGLPLTGSITFKPQAGGTAVGTVSGTLPGVLGGGPVTVTVTTSASGQVTSVVATGTSGTLANVFGLSSLNLKYTPSGWTVQATAQGANNTTQQMNGSLSFNSSGQVSAGNLSISNVVIAGLLQVKTFTVSYSPTAGWGGTANLAQGTQKANVSITINSNGVMTAGSIQASGITLWQVFSLKSFAMTYQQAGNTWGLSLAVAGKKGAPGVSASLNVSNGTVTGAALDFKNVSILGKITVDDLNLAYSNTGGHDYFAGSTELSLPSTAVSKVKGSFKMVDGQLTQATLDAFGNIPLYGALVLTHLGGEIDLIPTKKIIGKIDLSAGPKVAGRSLLALDNGQIEYDFPATTGGHGTYIFSGDLSALGKTLGQGKLTFDNDIGKLDLTLGSKGAGFKIGGRITANGAITGAIHGTKFTASGKVHLDVQIAGKTYPTGGELLASNNGILACSAAPISTISTKGDSGLFIGWDGAITTYLGDCPR